MISVIIPVYNSERYLADCLDHVLNQTYRDLELLCIDDGSTDQSAAILDRYAQRDSRIRVVHQPNSGVSAARNVGLDLAKGEFITFVDSDDTLEPDMYAHLLKLMTCHDADITHCGYRKVFSDGSSRDVGGTGELLVQDSMEAAICLLRGQHFTGGLWNKLYRAELFENTRFDAGLKMNEDVLLNAALFQKAEKIVFNDLPLYHYYERIGSSCSMMAVRKKKEDSVRAAEQIFAIYRDTAASGAAACKLHYSLCDLYRACLLSGGNTAEVRQQIDQKIKQVLPYCGALSSRGKWNYCFMHRLPHLYRLIYRAYDKIRTPNWDL